MDRTTKTWLGVGSVLAAVVGGGMIVDLVSNPGPVPGPPVGPPAASSTWTPTGPATGDPAERSLAPTARAPRTSTHAVRAGTRTPLASASKRAAVAAPAKPSTKAAKPSSKAPDAPKAPVVHAGAFCSPAGARGVSASGVSYVCRSVDGDQPRWRRA